MSQSAPSYLFFLKCPDLRKLVSFTAELSEVNVERKRLSAFHRRILKCRELLFSELELIATPAFLSRTEIIVVMQKKRFYSSEFQFKLKKMELRIIKADDALPTHIQACLHYTAIAKLAPQWNNVQDLLVQGRDFLTSSDPLRAIKLDIFVDGSEIILNVIPKCIKLPPFRVETYSKLYDVSENAISIKENVHVLPSLKKGTAVYLSKTILTKKLFKDYSEMKKHWKNMYGYRLPEIPEKDMWYLNVVFNVRFPTSFMYPVVCVKPFGTTEVPRVDPQLTLHSFVNDFCKKVNNICQERCQIMDTKASFPTLQLYRIEDILKDPLPRPGTTYTKAQNAPFRSSIVTQNNAGKFANNPIIQGNGSHSLFLENKIQKDLDKMNNVQKNAFNRLTLKTANDEEKLNKSNDTQLQNVAKSTNIINFKHDNIAEGKILNLSNSNGYAYTSISEYQNTLKACLGTQARYSPKFFPKKPNKEVACLSVNGTSKINPSQEIKPQEKYIPIFVPKQQRQNLQPIVDVRPKVKAILVTQKISTNKTLKLRALNHKELINKSLDFKLVPEELQNSIKSRKPKTPRINSKKVFSRQDECLQDDIRQSIRKNTNSRKRRMNDELKFSKENQTKNSKINKTSK